MHHYYFTNALQHSEYRVTSVTDDMTSLFPPTIPYTFTML